MKCKYLFTVFLIVIFFISGYTFAGDLELIIEVDSVDCFGNNSGRIFVTVNSGTPEYTFILFNEAPWKGGEELFRTEPIISNSYVFENLQAGKYNIAVEDINQNGKIVTVFISEPEKLALRNIEEITGDNLIIKANVQGGTQPYSYKWTYDSKSVNSDKISLVSEGKYICIINDYNNCGPIISNYYFYDGLLEKTYHKIIGK